MERGMNRKCYKKKNAGFQPALRKQRYESSADNSVRQEYGATRIAELTDGNIHEERELPLRNDVLKKVC
jgi:hypothetical protein